MKSRRGADIISSVVGRVRSKISAWNLKFPFATLAIITFSTVIYVLNSQGNPYIYPITKLALYGVSNVNWLIGGLLFSFTHIGLKHLMANMFVLAVLGVILEQRLSSWHVFWAYLISGWLAGVVYTFVNPSVWVIGSSAAICGLIGAGLVVDFKRVLLGLVLALYMIPIVVYPTADWIIINYYTHQEKVIQQNVEKIQTYQKQLENASSREKPRIIAKINETYKETKHVIQKVNKLEKGVKKEAETPTAGLIHILGGLFGILYLAIFSRDSFKYLARDLNGIFRAS